MSGSDSSDRIQAQRPGAYSEQSLTARLLEETRQLGRDVQKTFDRVTSSLSEINERMSRIEAQHENRADDTDEMRQKLERAEARMSNLKDACDREMREMERDYGNKITGLKESHETRIRAMEIAQADARARFSYVVAALATVAVTALGALVKALHWA